ncbi:hypothetical protein K2173_019589 [Erythroxylum novogranatense]|uniref:Exocyst subunit Exo70 family protein n=1 Tax=Erythroxylum novogranatense TaxID=1862640 RepID=A0AAV8UBW3_9ROSI|nr:hypothetical protein K2173_019589 [Erythroxylum novogranatense]
MAENGEERLIAMARHIAQKLGHNESMADDILQIFSNFDGRFTRENLNLPDKFGPDDPRALAALDHTLKSLERQISQYVGAGHPIWSDSADSSAFLDAVDDLIAVVRQCSSMSAVAAKNIGACAEELLQQAMFRLEEEFGVLMVRGCESTDNLSFDSEDDEEESGGNGDNGEITVAQPLTDYNVIIDALPSGVISDLHEMVKRMVDAGFVKECSHVYSSCRRDFLEESISRLGLQKLSNEEVQRMAWPDLEDEIVKWIKASNVALRILFPSERRLCDRVFMGFYTAADLSFMEVTRGSTVQILNFADAVAIGSRSPERLFKVMDLFETLRDLMPEFESNFCDQYCLVLRNEAIAIWKRLGEAIRGIFMELENLIRRDPAKSPVPGGGVHPITRYVMNYLRAACRSRETLEQVFEESSNVVPAKDCSSSALCVRMEWIMQLLETNLELKSKVYGDPSLCCVFMMNNCKYIVQKVKDSELGLLLGDDWIRKHSGKIKNFMSSYQRITWNKVLGVLRIDISNGPPHLNNVGNSTPMKERMHMFNMSLEEIHRTQSEWTIFDEQLKKEVKMSLSKLLLPLYVNFLSKFQNSPEVRKNANKYIKYSLEDVDVRINELFQGGSGSSSGGGK